jgi:hypothetical protein
MLWCLSRFLRHCFVTGAVQPDPFHALPFLFQSGGGVPYIMQFITRLLCDDNEAEISGFGQKYIRRRKATIIKD